MRSGTGRHRRPRQAPAIVLAVGVTGASAALPLLASGSAVAADAGTWDKVAQCESGGMWSANNGNGLHGGLQMTQQMWEQNGGIAYAPRPDLASRSQQIAVAERILKAEGADTWRSCAVSSGLAGEAAQGEDKAPEVDPGDGSSSAAPEPVRPRTPGRGNLPAPERTSPAPSAPSSGSHKPAPGSSGSPTPDSSGTPSASTSPSPDTSPGKHRKDPSGQPTTGTTPGASTDPTAIPTAPVGSPSNTPANTPSDTPGTGSSPSASPLPGDAGTPSGTGRHRGDPSPSGDAQRPSRGGEGRTDLPAANDYTVRPGDNLSAIAEQHSVAGGWQTLYQKNEKAVGSDPDLIRPGQRLDIKQ
ncbi:transglycosylase family protein [Streptomyces hesseae]|uniref:Transglycosylase family protein n=1 Tax=Streptomyces hesseae TaxID=3075519 RepID=A0ABU2SI74_9ACTN|nr:transglycosylase family protein [Streptomyces sp. DSM 40473]MDT0448674.1 transglycosylase family protein [Streptomyces sp. DSM 40473]